MEAKSWMERKLQGLKSGIPRDEISSLAEEWTCGQSDYDLEPRIVAIEAAEIAKRWHRSHVPQLGNMQKERGDGVLRCFGGQLNSASSRDVRDRKITEINWVVDEWDLQLGGFSEVGVNWKTYPSSYSFASWASVDRMLWQSLLTVQLLVKRSLATSQVIVLLWS